MTAPPTGSSPAAPSGSRPGVLLVNLGTPDAPRPREVRRYLREFLGDPLVLTMNPAARWLLLNLVILPFRPRRSAAAYAAIWTPAGSPLLVECRRFAGAVQAELGEGLPVELAMRYGSPSIAEGLERLLARGATRIVAFPLYPQYATATTGSTADAVERAAARLRPEPEVETIGAFFDHPGFIEAAAEVARPVLASARAEHVLLSFHGLPENQVRDLDPTGAHCLASPECCAEIGGANHHCYRAQCYATARLLARALALPPERWSVAFQSRLGRTPWIRPYTHLAVAELAARGVKRLAVLVPSFVADCLETLEEIGIRARARFREEGGEELTLVPCVNAHPAWARAACDMIRTHIQTASR